MRLLFYFCAENVWVQAPGEGSSFVTALPLNYEMNYIPGNQNNGTKLKKIRKFPPNAIPCSVPSSVTMSKSVPQLVPQLVLPLFACTGTGETNACSDSKTLCPLHIPKDVIR